MPDSHSVAVRWWPARTCLNWCSSEESTTRRPEPWTAAVVSRLRCRILAGHAIWVRCAFHEGWRTEVPGSTA